MLIRVVSLFCGIGGADLGLYMAADELGVSVEIVDAIDHWEPAVRVYNANLRHPVARVADVKQMTRADLPPHDLVLGGPPCQPHSLAGKRLGKDDPRDCLPDFLRLAGDTPYIMENVIPRLINAPWSEKLCAFNFGDVTSRKRWFYSNYLLHVTQTPLPLRIRDIREDGADERALQRRKASNRKGGLGKGNVVCDDGYMQSITSGHGGVSGFLRMAPAGMHKAGCCGHYKDDETLGSLTAHSWHGHDVRNGKLLAFRVGGDVEVDKSGVVGDDDVLPSLTASASHKHANNGSGKTTRGTYVSVGNEGCRNPTLLEMQRAHSFPDTWNWCGANSTQKGAMIANSWPVLMAKAVNKAMLQALIFEREAAA